MARVQLDARSECSSPFWGGVRGGGNPDSWILGFPPCSNLPQIPPSLTLSRKGGGNDGASQ